MIRFTYWCWLSLSGMAFAQSGLEPAQLIIYRQKDFGGLTYTIHVNEQKAGRLPSNHYVVLSLPAGRTKIESGKDYYTDPQRVWITLQPGGVYYLKAVEEMDFLTRTLLLVPVSESLARQQLPKLKPVKWTSIIKPD